MTADAEQVAERANGALSQIATLSEALACMDCERIFRYGPLCPFCGSQSLLNVSDCLGDHRIVQRLDNARKGINKATED